MEAAKRDGRWLYRLQDAKKADTRQRRLEKFVHMLEAGETLH
jgi:uncharacterized protein YdeI (YjbR/CyaY-like superfamily)